MSIYATLRHFGIKRFGDREMVHILIQSVPPHIDYVGSEWDFLPPPVGTDGPTMRAAVFVEPGDEKGTERNGQEYVKPLLTLAGREYEQITFAKLMEMLEAALDRRYGPRPGVIVLTRDGDEKRIY